MKKPSTCPYCGRTLPPTFAATVLGARGGLKNSPAQQQQRKQAKPGAGRPKKEAK